MAGGAASGKTEYVSAYLSRRRLIIFDGTLSTFEGAKIKIRDMNKAGKRVEIHLVLPSSLYAAFVAFVNRDRKFPLQHFYRTHSGSRKSVLKIAEEYPDVNARIFISEASPTDPERAMNFKEIIFNNRRELIEYLRDKQYNEEDIISEIMQS